MATLTALSRVFGLVRQAVIASFFGTSALSDAFIIAFKFPNLFRRLFAEGAMSAGFIPVFSSIKKEEGERPGGGQQAYFLKIITLLIIITSLITFLFIIISPLIVAFLNQEKTTFTPEIQTLSVFLMRLMFPYLVLISGTAILQGVLNSYHRFAVPAFTPVLFNVAIIASALIYTAVAAEKPGASAAAFLAAGVLLGGILQFSFQLPWVIRLGFTIKPDFNFRDPRVMTFFKLMFPVLFAAGIYQFNTVIAMRFAGAAHLPSGAFSALEFSRTIQELPLGIIIVSLSTVILPLLAGHFAAGEQEAAAHALCRALSLLVILIFPVIVYLLLFREEIVFTLYSTGRFNSDSVRLTATCLRYQGLAIGFIGLSRLLVSVFFAMKDTRTPLYLSLAGMLINFILLLLFITFLKLETASIALAALITSIFISVTYLVILLKRNILKIERTLVIDFLKITGSLVLPALFLLLFRARGFDNLTLDFIPLPPETAWRQKIDTLAVILVSALPFLACYFFSLKILGVTEINTIIFKIKQKFGKFPA